MAMMLAVTRNVPDRFGGFLASCMLEVAPGVYITPKTSSAVRDRIRHVMSKWSYLMPDKSGLLLLWQDSQAPSGLAMESFGWPKKELREFGGCWLSLSNLTQKHDVQELNKLLKMPECPW